jgi:hypothetical protein
MHISNYNVGQIPLRNLVIAVHDSDGNPLDSRAYTNVYLRMLGSDNEEVDLTGSYLNTGGAAFGRFVFEWPQDRSLFTEPGEYVMQLVLENATAKDITNTHTIRVNELGRLNR